MKLHRPKFRINVLFIVLLVIGILSACLDPFPLPDVTSGFLVVEGTFTDEPLENRIRVTWAGQVNEAPTWVKEARVTVSDDQGNTELYYHSDEGYYLPFSEDFLAVPGRNYVLRIELNDGRVYESESTICKEAVPIEDLRWEAVEAPSPDGTDLWKGVEIYLDTYDPTNESRYFLWKYEETWETVVPNPIRDVYIGNGNFREVFNSSRCFLEDRSRDIMAISTADQAISEIRNHPIIFVPSNTSRLYRHYRIDLTQYNLSEEAYIYHEKLQKITGQTGTIFDQQPTTLYGNVRNMNDESEIVMGYFIVSAVSKRSVDIQSWDLEPAFWGDDEHLSFCRAATRTYDVSEGLNYNWLFNRVVPRWGMKLVRRIYDDSSLNVEPPVVALEFAPPGCTECEGTQDKPLDWDEW